MDCGLTMMSFLTTNEQVGSMLNTFISELPSLNGADLTQQARVFVSRFESEVMSDVTFNNQVGCTVMVNADLIREVRISIKYAGDPELLFVVPTFADSLLTPLVTNNSRNSAGLVMSLSNLIETAQEVMGSKTLSMTNFKDPSVGNFFGDTDLI